MDVVIMVGNSDRTLGGRAWAEFVAEVRDLLASRVVVHAEWHSRIDSALANVVWRVEVPSMAVLRDDLTALARQYRNPSIAWLQGAIESVPV